MDYQQYINLGFKRQDFNDKVEFSQTGYYGFCLTKRIDAKMSVEVCSGELDKPKLYIKKGDTGFSHSFPISIAAVIDLFEKEEI